MCGSETIFRKPCTTAITTWLLSIIISIVSIKIDSLIAVWISLYFYIVGLAAFFHSFTKYAVMDVDGIKIYIGSFLRKIELNIDWNSIDRAEYTAIEKKWRTKIHGVDTGLNAPDQENEEGVLIKLNHDLKNEGIINKNLKLCDKLKLPNEKRFIYLPFAPRGGFKNFLATMQGYTKNISSDMDLQKENKSFVYKYINWLFGLSATALLVWNIVRI